MGGRNVTISRALPSALACAFIVGFLWPHARWSITVDGVPWALAPVEDCVVQLPPPPNDWHRFEATQPLARLVVLRADDTSEGVVVLSAASQSVSLDAMRYTRLGAGEICSPLVLFRMPGAYAGLNLGRPKHVELNGIE